MGRWGEDSGKSSQGFYLGLLLAALGVYLFALIGFTEVRYSLKGLREVHGQVIETESYKPGRRSGYWLNVKLQTESGVLRLTQDSAGRYADRLAPGQRIRAWIDPRVDDSTNPPSHRVWQIERGTAVVMPVMAVGDDVFSRMLWDSGYALIALLGGLYLVGRHLLQHSDEGGEAKEEGKSA